MKALKILDLFWRLYSALAYLLEALQWIRINDNEDLYGGIGWGSIYQRHFSGNLILFGGLFFCMLARWTDVYSC